MKNMTLAKRDLYLVRIEEEMNRKKKFLLDKYNKIGQMEQENEYLRMIRNDYSHYYEYIKKEKQDQIDAMERLSNYIDNIVIDGRLTDEDLEQTQKEQKKILYEIDSIKQGLDEITNNVETKENIENEEHTQEKENDIE